MDLTNIKAIFFDTSDTLYSNESLEAAYPQKLVELLATARQISQDEAKALLKVTAKKLDGTVKHVTKVRTMAELGFSRAQAHEAFCKVNPHEFLSPDKELNAIMLELSKKYKLGIISNLKRSHMLEVLDALGLSAELFPLLVTEDIVKEIKPDHEPFLKAIELSGYAANECLYVGDSPTKDMQPAKEVGMITVLVGNNIAEEQAQYIDAIIPDAKKVTDLLPES
ncbi:MAG TPA: HAD family hydrolase [Candidatus Saccharimonadales bacterium]